ncbi:formate dehydrogenase accessory sulfurtransferase FdhD [Tumebacillus amylolyticus]|uniref:formate dehydrogenase accessory sulfurtransferase FdhD n=1 Tax=Tumebacillus amylolyticus TaxID=2801339 RepID=UPI003D3140C5
MQPISTTRTVRSYRMGEFRDVQDTVVTEFPVTIYLNDEEFATVVCTPEYIEDMVVGFLSSEGVLRSYGDIRNVTVDPAQGFVYVETDKLVTLNTRLYNKRYITSCCGKSRQSFYFFNDARTVKTMKERRVSLSVENCFRLMSEMQAQAALFQETGGVHNASLCDQNGILLSRTDIGRHNALDKIYGHCLKNGISVDDKVIVFSGRISSEILLKVAKIGCEVVLSKSAPTQLALEMAEELGITAVGFIRNDTLNVYTHPERIQNSRS